MYDGRIAAPSGGRESARARRRRVPAGHDRIARGFMRKCRIERCSCLPSTVHSSKYKKVSRGTRPMRGAMEHGTRNTLHSATADAWAFLIFTLAVYTVSDRVNPRAREAACAFPFEI